MPDVASGGAGAGDSPGSPIHEERHAVEVLPYLDLVKFHLVMRTATLAYGFEPVCTENLWRKLILFRGGNVGLNT